jgi:hypothetical protein
MGGGQDTVSDPPLGSKLPRSCRPVRACPSHPPAAGYSSYINTCSSNLPGLHPRAENRPTCLRAFPLIYTTTWKYVRRWPASPWRRLRLRLCFNCVIILVQPAVYMYVLLCRHACMDHESMGRLLAYLFFYFDCLSFGWAWWYPWSPQDQARLRRDVSLPRSAPTARRIYVGAVGDGPYWLPIFFLKKLYLCGLKYICMQYIVFFFVSGKTGHQ